MTFGDIIASIFDYARQYPFENDSDLAANPCLLQDILDMLVNFDMIEAKDREINFGK